MHVPVLLEEAVRFLNVRPNGRYVDGTLGNGGHSEKILKQLGGSGGLLGLDIDPKSLEVAERRLQLPGNLITRRVNFRGLQGALQDIGWKAVDGILLDLGISSPQLDDPSRGLTFQGEGPLDMRLNPDSPETALSVLLRTGEEELADTLREFGEERNGRRLARVLRTEAAAGRLQTTADLARLCEKTVGRHGKIHPATKVFLALRVLVNDEYGALRDVLTIAPEALDVGGRLVVISFHSGEDRMVKHRFRELAAMDGPKHFSILTKKPVEPSEEEARDNPRARSAKLRALERIA